MNKVKIMQPQANTPRSINDEIFKSFEFILQNYESVDPLARIELIERLIDRGIEISEIELKYAKDNAEEAMQRLKQCEINHNKAVKFYVEKSKDHSLTKVESRY